MICRWKIFYGVKWKHARDAEQWFFIIKRRKVIWRLTEQKRQIKSSQTSFWSFSKLALLASLVPRIFSLSVINSSLLFSKLFFSLSVSLYTSSSSFILLILSWSWTLNNMNHQILCRLSWRCNNRYKLHVLSCVGQKINQGIYRVLCTYLITYERCMLFDLPDIWL